MNSALICGQESSGSKQGPGTRFFFFESGSKLWVP